jgi:apolipoprotein N-acyltransferase
VFAAVLVLLPCMTAVDLLADKGMTPFPTFKILLYVTGLSMVFKLIPYVIDRVFRRSLPVGLRVFLFPSLVIAVSFVLGSHGSWGAVANGFNDLALLQLVSVTGITGIAFLIHWTAVVVNEIWEQRARVKVVKKLAVAGLAVLVTVYVFGNIRLRSNYLPEKSLLAAGLVHDPAQRNELMNAFVTLVRSNPSKPDEFQGIRHFMTKVYFELLSSSASMADAGFDMVVWYEGAAVIFEEDEHILIQKAAETAKEKEIYLGISVAVYHNLSRDPKPGIQPLFKNKTVLISPQGEIEWDYSKTRLVPGMEAAISIPGDGIMKTGRSDIKITGAICYENDFPLHILQAAKLKAQLILAPSNDWEAIKHTHARMARLRSIENGISMLRPANGGISIAVDPFGRILSQVDNYSSRGAPLAASVPILPVSTIYGALGDYFNWLCLILSLVCLTFCLIFKLKTGREKAKNESGDF